MKVFRALLLGLVALVSFVAPAPVQAQTACTNYYNGSTLLGCFKSWKADGTTITCSAAGGIVTCTSSGGGGGTADALDSDVALLRRLQIGNLTSSPGALPNYTVLSVQSYASGSTGDVKWREVFSNTANVGDPARADFVHGVGFNLAENNTSLDGINPALGHITESYYAPGAGIIQMEDYVQYVTAAGVVYRPIAHNLRNGPGLLIQTLLYNDELAIGSSASVTWFQFYSGVFQAESGSYYRKITNNEFGYRQLNAAGLDFYSALKLNASDQWEIDQPGFGNGVLFNGVVKFGDDITPVGASGSDVGTTALPWGSVHTTAVTGDAVVLTLTGADGTNMTTSGGLAKVVVDDTLGSILQYNGTNGFRMGLWGVFTRRLQMAASNIADVNYTFAVPPNADPTQLFYSTLTAARVVTLPTVVTTAVGSYFIIGDASGNCSSTNTITITANGSDTINGVATDVISVANDSRIVYAAASGKWVSLKSATGSSATLAAAYTAGTSQASSTFNLNSTALGLLVKDASSPISGSLLRIQNNGGTVILHDTLGTGTAISQYVQTTGSPTLLTVTGAAHTSLTAATEAIDVNFNLTRTVQFATGGLTTQRAVLFKAPTYAFVGASALTNAATVAIDNAPQAGTNATLTNAYSLWIQAGAARFDGVLNVGVNGSYNFNVTGTNANNDLINIANTSSSKYASISFANSSLTPVVAIGFGNSGVADTIAQSRLNVYLGTVDMIFNRGSGIAAGIIKGTGLWGVGNLTSPAAQLDVLQATQTSASQPVVQITGGANTGMSASTDVPGFLYVAHSVQFSTGAKTFQGEFRINAPTYTAVAATTTTRAATLVVSGAPIASTNMTITNPFAISVEAGSISFVNGEGIRGPASLSRFSVSDSGGSTMTFNGNGITVGNFSSFSVGTNFLYTSINDASPTLTVNSANFQLYSAISAARAPVLPTAASTGAGKWFWIGDASGNCSVTNTITITRAGSDTINGATTLVLNLAYGKTMLVSDGVSKWTIF